MVVISPMCNTCINMQMTTGYLQHGECVDEGLVDRDGGRMSGRIKGFG